MVRQNNDKLAVLPDLYTDLMAQPLQPLLRGMLPYSDAVYILYRDDKPLTVGSPPHLDEMQWLAPSYRGSVIISIRASTGPEDVPELPKRSAAMEHNIRPKRSPIFARWFGVNDPLMRVGLEIYVSQKLDIAPCNPKVREILSLP